MPEVVHVGNVPVEVQRKPIKHMHLSVYPPTGEVRLSAPTSLSLEVVRLFAITKRDWIMANRRSQRLQEREPEREYLDRESHYLWGRRYLLEVVECDTAPFVKLDHSKIILQVRPGASKEAKAAVMSAWYRSLLREAAEPLIASWQSAIGVTCRGLTIRKMKTRWGTCNPVRETIRLNTELAKKPPQCLEYIIVHELAHLADPTHGRRFQQILDFHLPNWSSLREQLNHAPLGQYGWVTLAS